MPWPIHGGQERDLGKEYDGARAHALARVDGQAAPEVRDEIRAPGPEAEDDVALRSLGTAVADGEAEALGTRACVAHHLRPEGRNGHRKQHPAVPEEGAEPEKGRELGVAVEQGVEERAPGAG